MINLSYLQTSRVLQDYWEKPEAEGKNEGKIACPNKKTKLNETAYLTE